MAKQTTKKETEKKVNKNETVEVEQITEKVVTNEAQEEIGETPYGIEGPAIEEVENAIEKVETNFEENAKENEEVLNEELEKANQIEKDFGDMKENFDQAIENAETPEEKENIIKQEIAKAEDLKQKAKKIIKTVDNAGFTSVWNGTTYDM